MKQILLLALVVILSLALPIHAKTIEVDVHGMTCALCVDTLNRKFDKMQGVLGVKVSMKVKKVQLEVDSSAPSLEVIKQTILDAGFTPTKITVLTDEASKIQR